MRERMSDLPAWIEWRHLPERFAHLGLGTFWDRLQKEPPPRGQLVPIFTKAFLGSWYEAVTRLDPALSAFRRPEHEQIVAEFRELDRRQIQINRQRNAQLAASGRPRLDQAGAEGGVLQQEAGKKANHLPLPRLPEEIHPLLLQLKPCLLLLPKEIARFLPANLYRFDLAIIDEADQLCVEHALPALYRARQVLVLGDDQAPLPPGEEGPGESLLAACQKAGLAVRHLQAIVLLAVQVGEPYAAGPAIEHRCTTGTRRRS